MNQPTYPARRGIVAAVVEAVTFVLSVASVAALLVVVAA